MAPGLGAGRRRADRRERWLIASQFRTGEPLAASTITLTTGFGVVSVTFWAFLVG